MNQAVLLPESLLLPAPSDLRGRPLVLKNIGSNTKKTDIIDNDEIPLQELFRPC